MLIFTNILDDNHFKNKLFISDALSSNILNQFFDILYDNHIRRKPLHESSCSFDSHLELSASFNFKLPDSILQK